MGEMGQRKAETLVCIVFCDARQRTGAAWPLITMPMLSEDDLNLRDMSAAERASREEKRVLAAGRPCST